MEQQLVRYQNLPNIKNANSAPAKEAVNNYDLWINGWVIQNIGVFRTRINPHHHLRDYPMILWYNDYFVAKSNFPSSYIAIKKIKIFTQIPVWHQNGQINRSTKKIQRCDCLNTILGSDIGLEKCRSRQKTNRSESE